MRIAHVIPTYVPAYRYGGPIRAVHGLACAQAAAGDEVEVYTTDRDGERRLDVPLGEPVELDGHRVRYFPLTWPARTARSPALVAALAGRMPQLDAVHLHSVFLWPTTAAARAARRAQKPYFVSPRGMLDRELIHRRGALRKRLWLALEGRRMLRGAARLVATSESEAGGLHALGFAWASIAVVPNGVDLAEWTPPLATEVTPALRELVAGGPYLLFLGRLSWKKQIDLLIHALSRVAALRLIVAGPDDEGLRPELESLARRTGAAERVRFAGEVHGADRRALLHGASAVALVSVAENFGNAVLEAMACAVPVLVTPGVGLAGEVEDAGAGRVVAADPEAIGVALAALAADPERARAMGLRGRVAVEERFTWRAVAEQMRAVYREAGAA
jgi:glycosyltransferase involved in cell wall biosynthesis